MKQTIRTINNYTSKKKIMKLIKKYIRIIPSFFAITALLFVGCDNVTDSDSGLGTLEIRMQYAEASKAAKVSGYDTADSLNTELNGPVDLVGIDSINIFVRRVEMNNSTSDEGWQVVAEPESTFNLFELTDGFFEVLGVTELEEGNYPQIRLILGDQNSILLNGEEFGLFVPSGEQTGLKINANLEIASDEEHVLTLDFETANIIRTGPPSSPQYLMTPVIRVAGFSGAS